MSAADSLRNFITPLLPGWRIQFGRWVDGSKTDRFAVLRPAGGLPAELVRRPHFTLMLVGALDQPSGEVSAAANSVIEAMRVSSGDLVFMQPGEPVYHATDDGRPVFEIAITTITN
ncbi:hypothetical protein [Xylophilus sp. GOD-11R]|uniref:phage tail termination protein n=1 Tax=Xylophilus sp. GOD-11R TaxID=3089814 RepID=UPI00298D2897|nr:hypothetical protein [Xylophilus sp. GOD-11R]WPB58642.1 hypothetical protein R9X41_08400 [Xylophilus sp. GOD-11R]